MSNKLIQIIVVIIAVLSLPTIAVGIPVPWNSWDYHTHVDASHTASGSGSDDAYSPPLTLPIGSAVSVYSNLGEAEGHSSIISNDMTISTFARDLLGSDASANATAEFGGTFLATMNLFQFSYLYNYGVTSNCSSSSLSVCSSAINGWLTVRDDTNHITIFDSTFLDVNSNSSASGSNILSVPIIIGHEIQVDFGINGWSYASYGVSGSNNLTLQYDTAINKASAVPEPSTMFLLGSGLIGLVGFRKKFKI